MYDGRCMDTPVTKWFLKSYFMKPFSTWVGTTTSAELPSIECGPDRRMIRKVFHHVFCNLHLVLQHVTVNCCMYSYDVTYIVYHTFSLLFIYLFLERKVQNDKRICSTHVFLLVTMYVDTPLRSSSSRRRQQQNL